MTRTTQIIARKTGTTAPRQNVFDTFWNWIEETPQTDEMWRVQPTGDMVLVVDEETLVAILSDDLTKAHEDFDYYEDQESDTGAWVTHNLPDYLLGTYTIKGVYDEFNRYVDGERTYFFSQEF